MTGSVKWGVIGLGVLLGCGGNGPPPVVPEPEPVRMVDPVPPPVDPRPPVQPVEEPGAIEITATFLNEPVQSEVEVRRQGQPDVVARASLGPSSPRQSLSLPPGRYSLSATFPATIDGAVETKENVRVQSGGRPVRVDFTFENVSVVTLQCVQNNRQISGKIRLRRAGSRGDWLPEVHCGREFIIQGGSYEAEVTVGGGRSPMVITVSDLGITGGGRVTTPIRIDTGGR